MDTLIWTPECFMKLTPLFYLMKNYCSVDFIITVVHNKCKNVDAAN